MISTKVDWNIYEDNSETFLVPLVSNLVYKFPSRKERCVEIQ